MPLPESAWTYGGGLIVRRYCLGTSAFILLDQLLERDEIPLIAFGICSFLIYVEL